MDKLEHLGGLTANQFLRRHWQKKPLLVRGAFPDFRDPLTKKEVFTLAMRDEAESRMIVRAGKNWQLHHGPFSRGDFARHRDDAWTVLVQDTQHFSQEAHALLAQFRFIPHARIDDLMVSFAVAGAGVGPHVDSYDVFLLQGAGQRRWRISAQTDLTLRKDTPLKILSRFKPEQEFLLETGDMLYLPPGYAHDGIAESECLTWSIGFRAPTAQELAIAYLDRLRDEIAVDGQYTDQDLRATIHPGEIDAGMLRRMMQLLREVNSVARNHDHMRQFLGKFLTEPKAHVLFDPPEPVMSKNVFRRFAMQKGIALDLKSRLLFTDDRFFLNGNLLDVGNGDAALMRSFADDRAIAAKALANTCKHAHADSLLSMLYCLYRDGAIQIGA